MTYLFNTMAFKQLIHPLGWGDKELTWLITTGMNATNLYRAMGYRGTVITPQFKERLYKLGWTGK